jgi:hypothetical protein
MMHWKGMTTAERVKACGRHAKKGLTATQIAAKFKDRPSRSAVLGLCNRNGVAMNSRQAKERRKLIDHTGMRSGPKLKPRPEPKPFSRVRTAPIELAAPIPAPDAKPMTFIEASDRNTCRWPLWDRFEGPYVSMCCGAHRPGSGPYCDHHEQIQAGRGTQGEQSAPRDLKRHIMRERGIT